MTNTVTSRLWSVSFVLAWLITFAMVAVFFLLLTTMTIFAVERFSVGEAAAGFAATSFVLSATLVRLGAGALVERVGRKPALIAALAAYLAGCFVYELSDNFLVLIGIRMLHGIAFGIGTTAVMTIAQSLIPPSRRGEGTAYFTISTTGATAIGPLLLLLMFDGTDFTTIYLGCGIMLATALVAALCLRAPEPDAAPAQMPRRTIATFLEPSIAPFAVCFAALGAAFAVVIAFVNAFAINASLQSAAQAFFIAYAVAVVASRLVVGRVQDVRGDTIVMLPALAAFAASIALLAGATNTAMLVGSGILLGIGWGTLMSATQTIAIKRAAPHRLGLAVSTYYFVLDTGTTLGPVLFGFVLARSDYHVMFGAVAALVVVAAVLYVVAARTDERNSS